MRQEILQQAAKTFFFYSICRFLQLIIIIFFFPFSLFCYFCDILADLLPSDSYTPTLHLVAYSVNQKGRSEPTVLEDIAINEAEKRTGMYMFHSVVSFCLQTKTFVYVYILLWCRWAAAEMNECKILTYMYVHTSFPNEYEWMRNFQWKEGEKKLSTLFNEFSAKQLQLVVW